VPVPGADAGHVGHVRVSYHCETALSLLADPPALLAPLVPETARHARIELIDLLTVLPWDVETVVESVRRTGRLVIVHPASRTVGVGEIAAGIQSKGFLKLHAPCVVSLVVIGSKRFYHPLTCGTENADRLSHTVHPLDCNLKSLSRRITIF
jgi:hypothetical protein